MNYRNKVKTFIEKVYKDLDIDVRHESLYEEPILETLEKLKKKMRKIEILFKEFRNENYFIELYDLIVEFYAPSQKMDIRWELESSKSSVNRKISRIRKYQKESCMSDSNYDPYYIPTFCQYELDAIELHLDKLNVKKKVKKEEISDLDILKWLKVSDRVVLIGMEDLLDKEIKKEEDKLKNEE